MTARDVRALRQRIKDLEALHEARAEMGRCCYGPEVSDQKGFAKAERRFDRLCDKLWPDSPSQPSTRSAETPAASCEFCGSAKHSLAECPLPGATPFRAERSA